MAIDFANPVQTQNFNTGVLQSIRDHFSAVGAWLDPTFGGMGYSNQATGTKRYNGSSGLFEYWNGSAWANLAVAYVRQDGVNTPMTGRLISAGGVATGNNGIGVATGSLGEVEVRGNGTGAAMMTFHRPDAYASYLGIDTDNQWKIGGWSAGAVAYKLWHEGNFALAAPDTYGSYAVGGANGGYAGWQFSSGTKKYTFMVDTATGLSGMYGKTDAAWKWYFDSSSVLQAGTVPWTSINSRPTAVSFFTNDSAYITASALSPYALKAGAAFSGDVTVGAGIAFYNATGNIFAGGSATVAGDITSSAGNMYAAHRFYGGGGTTNGLGLITVTTTTGTPSGGSDGDFTFVY